MSIVESAGNNTNTNTSNTNTRTSTTAGRKNAPSIVIMEKPSLANVTNVNVYPTMSPRVINRKQVYVEVLPETKTPSPKHHAKKPTNFDLFNSPISSSSPVHHYPCMSPRYINGIRTYVDVSTDKTIWTRKDCPSPPPAPRKASRIDIGESEWLSGSCCDQETQTEWTMEDILFSEPMSSFFITPVTETENVNTPQGSKVAEIIY